MRGLGLLLAPMHSQVGKEVIEQFMAFDPIAETAFRPDPNEAGKYLGNLLSNRHTTPQQIRYYPNLRWGALHIQ